MFWTKKLREADKKIKNQDGYITDSEGDAVITIKAANKEQIFSRYEFDSSEKLNDELASYIEDKAKLIPTPQDIKIKIYADEDVKKDEVETAIKANFKREYIATKKQNVKNWFFALSMFVMGALFLGLLLISMHFFKNEFVDTILEIIAWVFLWEMADALFLRRSSLRFQMVRYLKLCSAKIEVVNLENIDKV